MPGLLIICVHVVLVGTKLKLQIHIWKYRNSNIFYEFTDTQHTDSENALAPYQVTLTDLFYHNLKSGNLGYVPDLVICKCDSERGY